MEKLHTTLRMLRGKFVGFFALLLVMGISLLLTPNVSYAQVAAGTSIDNSATATYTDNNGNPQTVTSNTVSTIVQQVAAVAISGSTTQSGSAGGQVLFSHTVTNNGNGSDTLNVSYTQGAGDFNFDTVTFYLDADNNGVPDDYGTPLANTTGDSNTDVDVGPVAAGGSVTIIAVGTIPTTAQNADSQTLTVTVTSSVDGTKTDSKTDTATIADVVVNAQKSLSSNAGVAGDSVVVTLSFTNNGTDTADSLVVTDDLDSRFLYQAGTGRYNSVVKSDADDSTTTSGADTYTYNSANGSNGGGLVRLYVGSLASGATKTLTFAVKIASGYAGQTIPNTATYNHANITSPASTNTVNFTVNQSYGVVRVDTSGTPNDGIILQDSVSQGASINFLNIYKNTGTTSDSFDITLSGQSNYPVGTTFTLFHADASGNPTSSLGSNNTGPVASGDSVAVVVQVNLPAGASGVGPFDLTKTAISTHDPSKTAVLTDRLGKITTSTVDVTNGSPGDYSEGGTPAPGQGVNATGETAAVTTKTTNPGTTQTFVLYVNNTSAVGDNYDLAASTDNSFSNVTLPAGWSVTFKNAGGSTITNTGNIAAGGNVKVNAVVNIPAGATPGTTNIFFRAKSPTTIAADVKHDAVIVSQVRSITLTPSDAATMAPGGTVYYTPTLKNTGNVTENNGTNSNLMIYLDNTVTTSNWQAAVYYDANGDGTIAAATDTLIATASGSSNSSQINLPGSLAPGAQVHFIVKVTTTAGVSDGANNTTTLTITDATSALSDVSIQDITTVVAGNLVITKKQSTDGVTYGTADINAKPGDSVYYQIQVTNNGSATVTNVVVTDNTPSYTTMAVQPIATGDGSPSIAATTPANGNSGTVKITVASLAAGQSFTVTFAVKINN